MIYIKCLNNYEEGIPVNNYISIVNENKLRFYKFKSKDTNFAFFDYELENKLKL